MGNSMKLRTRPLRDWRKCDKKCYNQFSHCRKQTAEILKENDDKTNQLADVEEENKSLKQSVEDSKVLSIEKIAYSYVHIKLHTGLLSYDHFEWLYNKVHEKAANMHYYTGK